LVFIFNSKSLAKILTYEMSIVAVDTDFGGDLTGSSIFSGAVFLVSTSFFIGSVFSTIFYFIGADFASIVVSVFSFVFAIC
jgi:hypothetical protein